MVFHEYKYDFELIKSQTMSIFQCQCRHQLKPKLINLIGPYRFIKVHMYMLILSKSPCIDNCICGPFIIIKIYKFNKFGKLLRPLFKPWVISSIHIISDNRPSSKMAAENSNKLKLKTYTSTRKSIFTSVTLQSFSISGVILAEKM